MFNKYLTYYRPGMQMVVFLALFSMTISMGQFVLEFLNNQLLGMTTEEFGNLKEVPQGLAGKFKLTEILAMCYMLLLPAALFAYLSYPKPLEYVRIKIPTKIIYWIMAIVVMTVALPFSGLLELWNAKIPFPSSVTEMDERYTTLAKSMLSGTRLSDLFLNILAISIVPAIIEELFFRGCFQNIMLSWFNKNHFTALLITAILFSLFHGQMSGFFPRIFLGLLLGLGYYYTGSLWISILMHAFNNLVSVVMVYLYNTHQVNVDVTNLPEVPLWFGLLSAVATVGLLYYFYSIRTPHQIIEMHNEIEDEIKNIG